MKRVTYITLILAVLFMASAVFPVVPLPMPSGNGDVNADGVLDLSDAVYLLTHLQEWT
jgi:hypothetical protein